MVAAGAKPRVLPAAPGGGGGERGEGVQGSGAAQLAGGGTSSGGGSGAWKGAGGRGEQGGGGWYGGVALVAYSPPKRHLARISAICRCWFGCDLYKPVNRTSR